MLKLLYVFVGEKTANFDLFQGVDKTRNRTRTGGRGLADWWTRTRGLADADRQKKIEKYLKKKKNISKDDAPTSFPFLKH